MASRSREVVGGRLFGVILVCLMLASCSQEYSCWYTPGPFQVLVGDEEVWFFLEADRLVRRPRGPLGIDVPPVIPVGHLQEVVKVSADGPVRRTSVGALEGRDGVTFHPRLSCLFRWAGEIYMLTGRSRYYESTFFRWDGKRFHKILPQEAEELFPFEFSSLHDLSFFEQNKYLDEITQSEGWVRLAAETNLRDFEADWEGHFIQVEFEDLGEVGFAVGLRSQMQSGESDSARVLFSRQRRQINREEYKSLSREEKGHPRIGS